MDNEIPGMNKGRIARALQKEGIEQVRFFNTDGALGYHPDDSYFAEKMITLARLKNWAMEKLSTLDVSSAVKRANEIGFDQVEMIQDDKRRWALYLKPENKPGYSIYPDKEDINRFSPRSSSRWIISARYGWSWRTSIMRWRKSNLT